MSTVPRMSAADYRATLRHHVPTLTLAARPVDEPDLLALLADQETPLGKPFADRFRETCKAVADEHDGWIDPNLVRARMLAVEDFSAKEVRQYAGLWSKAAGRDGYLDVHRDIIVPISGPGSTRNTNKGVPMRRWRGWSA